MFEEGLWRHSSRTLRTIAAAHPRETTAVLLHDVRVRIGEGLSALCHHVRNRIDVERQVFVSNSASDVAQFECDPARQLALDGKVERVNHVGTEVRV